ncbi:MAG: glycosyltransferase family 2 protein [bacterium]|nr:glycosyltransferase family 2 protein [bacterium]
MTKPTKPHLKLSVVVCTYNRDCMLAHCLRSLTNQTVDPKQFEVIVVDNNSTDKTRYVILGYEEHFPYIRSIKEPKQGLSNARNAGWRAAKGTYVAYLDDDAQAVPAWCERIIAAFETASPQPVAVGGVIHPWYEDYPPPWFSDDLEIRSWGDSAGFLNSPDARYGFSGSNMAFRREVLETFGGFSDSFGMDGRTIRMSEEVELFCRIYRSEPYFWYDPSIKVLHFAPFEHMTCRYRFKRGFQCGKARAQIDGDVFFSPVYKARLKSFLRYLIGIPRLFGKCDRKTVFMRCASKCGWHIGYLLGCGRR